MGLDLDHEVLDLLFLLLAYGLSYEQGLLVGQGNLLLLGDHLSILQGFGGFHVKLIFEILRHPGLLAGHELRVVLDFGLVDDASF